MNTSRISISLDLPDMRVLDVQVSPAGDYVLTLESTLNGARCRRCGQIIRKLHGSDEWVTARHLPILGHCCAGYPFIRPLPRRKMAYAAQR